MAQDLRELLKNDDGATGLKLREGHMSRFEGRLEKALPQAEDTNDTSSRGGIYLWMKIAAVLIIAGGVIWFVGKSAFAEADDSQIVSTETEQQSKDERAVMLSDIAPGFKKVEDKYLASVNLELSQLEITDDNKELVDAFLKELADLDAEYIRLNQEITETGISEEMVGAMLDNLKLRLELLMKLKVKLKELKADAEQQNAIQTI